jgi:hypothetical protein
MTDVVWPLLKAAVLEQAPGWDGWGVVGKVYGGPLTTSSPPKNYAQIGYNGVGESGHFTQEQDPSGWETDEGGSLSGELNFSTGDDGSTPEDLLFAALVGVRKAIFADRRLGVLPPQSSLAFVVTLAPVRNKNGSGYIARFSLNYTAVFS